MSKKVLLVSIVIATASVCTAQSGKQYSPIYQSYNKYMPRGWTFAPGITYMLPASFSRDETRTVFSENSIDTLYSGTFKSAGKIGAYLEVGRHHFLSRFYFLHHIDYGAHFKMLRGKEDFSGIMNADTSMLAVDNKGRFSESFAGLFFNASNIWQVGDDKWIHNSLGFNGDYRVISRRNYEGYSAGMLQEFPPNLLFQLHYKIGFGWKPQKNIFVMPMLETPILSIVPMDDGKSTLQYFSSRYRPIIFTLRFMFLDKSKFNGPECGDQPRNGGFPDGIDKENPGKNKGGDPLFGPDAKPKKAKRKGG